MPEQTLASVAQQKAQRQKKAPVSRSMTLTMKANAKTETPKNLNRQDGSGAETSSEWMEEAQGPPLEERTVRPWMQAPEPEGTTIKGKEESRGKMDKTKESDESIQPSPISTEKDTHGN
uniref:Uncharacterized protein n=1 Tax=Tanacetum cinerariifolium TaxID=118510 RepID=A0A699L094_TANCI|nr:hypothetical protein [Tanacetum cinerariifolium]